MTEVDRLMKALNSSLCPSKLEAEVQTEFRRLEAIITEMKNNLEGKK